MLKEITLTNYMKIMTLVGFWVEKWLENSLKQ